MMRSALMYWVECDVCKTEDPSEHEQESPYYAQKAFGWDTDADGRDICRQCRRVPA